MEDKFNTGETRYFDKDGNELTEEEFLALTETEEIPEVEKEGVNDDY